MARAKKNGADAAPMTTAQMLGSLLKSARDIMRKDKGLNGDLDRLPLLTWIMFLKFLDDLEQQREDEAKLAGKKFKPAIEAPYRWRDWAADSQGFTGDELLSFINADEAVRPDGSKGAGLFAYLRSLSSSNGDNRRDVIATVFKGVDNRMKSGYLLRDIINKVGAIHFTSSDELHTLGALYESMLREMRDAAGDSGEFYTPRAVVRFMVEVTDPRLGETVLDPASGTGGFLVEAYNYLERQVKTVADRKRLQSETISGCEPKSLPYLLCQMNLLLHGLDAPQIDPGNALRFKLSEIGEKERVDVILTNPPFGGEEEKGIQGNFPEDRQTSETALLFLQLIMRKLKRQPTSAKRPARAAVVVPNGTLYGDGVCARIKDELLKEFNLHTVVRLPSGVFSPYTPIPTNILFFDRSGPTKNVWYYEQPLPEGRRAYTKTLPVAYDDLRDCLSWWNDRSATTRSWLVPVAQILESGCNLDIKNPHRVDEAEAVVPPEIIISLRNLQTKVLDHIDELQELAGQILEAAAPVNWRRIKLQKCMKLVENPETVMADKQYPNVGIYSFGRGLFQKQPIDGALTSANTLYKIHTDQFIYSRLFAFEGAYGVVPAEYNGFYVSNEYPTFDCSQDLLRPSFLATLLRSPAVWRQIAEKSKGLGDRRQRIKPEHLLDYEITLPPLQWQDHVIRLQAGATQIERIQTTSTERLALLLPSLLNHTLNPTPRSSFANIDKAFKGDL
jgi:type I restriction enzyme M protein